MTVETGFWERAYDVRLVATVAVWRCWYVLKNPQGIQAAEPAGPLNEKKISGNIARSQSPIDVPQAKPINDTWWRRNFYLLAIKLTRTFTKRSGGGVLDLLGRRACVKCHPWLTLANAATLRFIAQHTSIPVPKVYCAFEHKGRVYVVMEFIRAPMVAQGWRSRSPESRAKIHQQLRRMIDELRSIPSPKHLGVANVAGGPLFDPRLPGKSLTFGPFKDTAEFHLHIREGWDQERCSTLALDRQGEIQELIKQHEGSWPLRFTHGDLSSLNILARGDEVVGIVDWDTAGWYPSYWEYTTAWHVNPYNEFWQDEVDNFLEPMPEALAMEQTRRKYFKDF
ncbi:MAG: hypothetical protein LQ341_002261 [Variospora aurantia]|nr:MAG: hypothetical protein LQ341_002261 [Variospora aurantia]